MAKAKAAIVAEPKGLNVATVTELCKKLRDAKIDYRVVKNTLAARAAKGTPVEPVAEKFVGPTALVMSYDDVVTPAKLLAEFMKDRENFTIRAAIIEGKVVDAKGVQALAKLPGLQELRGQIAALIAQPATKLVRMIGTPGQQLARVLGARREQLEKQWGVSAAAAPVMVAAAGGAAAAAPVEEKTEFTVVLVEAGANKINVIK